MIKIEELQAGSGEAAKTGDTVEIKYRGSFPDGKEFDKGVFPFQLGSGQVIQGFDLGVMGMNVGQKRRITVPPEMGYGARGAGGAIPPNATLVFEIELLKIK
ncbi:MAG: FKBP-type peptidyl-prolyl cis-trans isomerase [Fimbriimonas sp.]